MQENSSYFLKNLSKQNLLHKTIYLLHCITFHANQQLSWTYLFFCENKNCIMTKRLLLIHGNINIRINKCTNGTLDLVLQLCSKSCFAAGPHGLPSAELTVKNVLKFLGFCLTARFDLSISSVNHSPIAFTTPQDFSKPFSNPCSHFHSVSTCTLLFFFSISELSLERLTMNYIYNIIQLQSNWQQASTFQAVLQTQRKFSWFYLSSLTKCCFTCIHHYSTTKRNQ